MRKRVLIAAVIIPLVCGVSLALAQRPKAARASRAVKSRNAAKSRKAVHKVSRFIEPRKPWLPTAEELTAKAKEAFDRRPWAGNVVKPDLGAKGATLDLHNKVAAMLRTVDVPANRAEMYQHHLQLPGYRHRGWKTSIREVSPAPGGYNVRVTVSPILDYVPAMHEIYVDPMLTERYFTDGKTVQYLGSERTPGATGIIALD